MHDFSVKKLEMASECYLLPLSKNFEKYKKVLCTVNKIHLARIIISLSLYDTGF